VKLKLKMLVWCSAETVLLRRISLDKNDLLSEITQMLPVFLVFCCSAFLFLL